MTRKVALFTGVVLIALLQACKPDPSKDFDTDKTFPEVKSISEFPQSVFLPTLETTFHTQQNGIYAVSLLMAWQEIKNEIGLDL